MKKIFILTLLLFTAALIFGIDKAAAQSMRLGIDGIEFTSVDEQKSPVAVGLPVRYSSSTSRLRYPHSNSDGICSRPSTTASTTA